MQIQYLTLLVLKAATSLTFRLLRDLSLQYGGKICVGFARTLQWFWWFSKYFAFLWLERKVAAAYEVHTCHNMCYCCCCFYSLGQGDSDGMAVGRLGSHCRYLCCNCDRNSAIHPQKCAQSHWTWYRTNLSWMMMIKVIHIIKNNTLEDLR